MEGHFPVSTVPIPNPNKDVLVMWQAVVTLDNHKAPSRGYVKAVLPCTNVTYPVIEILLTLRPCYPDSDRWLVTQKHLGKLHWKMFAKGQARLKNILIW